MIEVIDCLQGSDEWHRARLGLPTASKFSAVLAKGEGKTRRAYMLQLAAEIITEELGESFTTPAMDRGKMMEEEARSLYQFTTEADLTQVGFIRNGPVGWSPDSLIGNSGALEIKTQRADLLIDTILKDVFPSEHKAQCQGGLWVGEREWIDLCVYYPKMPTFVKRTYRDEPYIKNLASEVDKFRGELADLVEQIRRYGEMAEAA
jgi:CRISPR/Cas system-associated protein Cas7 (RAMP superfamily)